MISTTASCSHHHMQGIHLLMNNRPTLHRLPQRAREHSNSAGRSVFTPHFDVDARRDKVSIQRYWFSFNKVSSVCHPSVACCLVFPRVCGPSADPDRTLCEHREGAATSVRAVSAVGGGRSVTQSVWQMSFVVSLISGCVADRGFVCATPPWAVWCAAGQHTRAPRFRRVKLPWQMARRSSQRACVWPQGEWVTRRQSHDTAARHRRRRARLEDQQNPA